MQKGRRSSIRSWWFRNIHVCSYQQCCRCWRHSCGQDQGFKNRMASHGQKLGPKLAHKHRYEESASLIWNHEQRWGHTYILQCCPEKLELWANFWRQAIPGVNAKRKLELLRSPSTPFVFWFDWDDIYGFVSIGLGIPLVLGVWFWERESRG